jgi:quercetin dioxygenase-like cupin family protein
MATRGEEFSNLAGRQRLIIRQTAADTGGRLLEMEAIYAPDGASPPPHAHPRQEERFTMLSGAMQVRMAGRELLLEQGGVLVIPADTPHTMWNDGEEVARFRWEVRPALRTEDFFAHLYGLAGQNGGPPLLQLAALFRAYRDEFRLAKATHRLLFGVLGTLARWRGTEFRATPPASRQSPPVIERGHNQRGA